MKPYWSPVMVPIFISICAWERFWIDPNQFGSCQFALDLFCFASDLFQSPPNHPDSLWIWDSDPNLNTALVIVIFNTKMCTPLPCEQPYMCARPAVSEHGVYTHCTLCVNNWTSLQIDWVHTETLYALNLRCEHSPFIQSINQPRLFS